MSTARLVPWDTSASDSAQESFRSIELAIDVLADFQEAEEADILSLEERLELLQRAENLLREAYRLVGDGRGAIARRLTEEARAAGRESCRKCFAWRDPKQMISEPFSYGTHGEESVRWFCKQCFGGP